MNIHVFLDEDGRCVVCGHIDPTHAESCELAHLLDERDRYAAELDVARKAMLMLAHGDTATVDETVALAAARIGVTRTTEDPQ